MQAGGVLCRLERVLWMLGGGYARCEVFYAGRGVLRRPGGCFMQAGRCFMQTVRLGRTSTLW